MFYTEAEKADLVRPEFFASIRPHDCVTIFVPGGLSKFGYEWQQATGRVVMRGPAGWVVNTRNEALPRIASPENIVAVRHQK